MNKAYDFSALWLGIVAECEKGGVQVADEALQQLLTASYGAVKAWIKESAALSPNKIDDVLASVIDYADNFVLPAIQKVKLEKSPDA